MPRPHLSGFAFTSTGKVQLYSTDELLNLPEPTWLINHILPANGLIGIFGPSEVGKSFCAIDMGLSVAAGIPWQGHATQRGLVVYISAEGASGLGLRVRTWLKVRGLDTIDLDIAWATESVPIYVDSEYMEALFSRFDELQRMPVLVVVDTLARCFAGNENETEDMNNFVAGLDRFRTECGSSVLVVHHTNVSEGRERGSTAFRAAMDTMISVLPGAGLSRTQQRNVFTLACSKMKDAAHFPKAIGQLVPEGKSCTIALTWQADDSDDE